MQRLSYPTKTVLSNKITRNRIVLSFKGSAGKPLRRRPEVWGTRKSLSLFGGGAIKGTALLRGIAIATCLDPIEDGISKWGGAIFTAHKRE